MSFYESVFLARPDITTEQVEGLANTFSKIIEDQGGKVTGRENWGLRGLSFRIKKNRKAHYIMLNIDAPGPAIHEMERQMRLNEDVIRYLTIKVDALTEYPSIMMQNKSSRDERPRRDSRGREEFTVPSSNTPSADEELVKAKTDAQSTDEATEQTPEQQEGAET